MSILFATFLLSFVVLLWSGKILPKALSEIAQSLHFSEFVTAFILVSFATSIPELFVGISSAFQGVPDLSVASIIGSNIANITIVIGIALLVAGKAQIEGKISSQNYWLISLLAFLPIILLADGLLSRVDGVILLVAFALYLRKLFKDRSRFKKPMSKEGESTEIVLSNKPLKAFGKFIIGTVFLLASSFALVWSSKLIVAEYFNADIVLFGIIFVALGTSLPEIAFGVRASLDGHSGAMLGNALGSIAFNAAGILGIVAIIRPIQVNFSQDYLIASLFLLASFALFHFFAFTQKRLTRKEGFLLSLFYVIFLFVLL